MKFSLTMILPMLTVSCMTVNQDAICDGTLATRDAHTTALIDDGGPKSKKTGATLIAQIDAGCNDA